MTEKKENLKDPRFLERDELERELVRRDKQSLIGDALKIFDTNTMLFDQLETSKVAIKSLEGEKRSLNVEVDRLRSRTLWAVLNERVALRIEKIRARRKSHNSPVV